jgi:hypothetical protein
LKLEFGDVDEDGEDFNLDGKPHKITQKALRGRYDVIPVATSLTHSPEARIQVAQQQQKVQIDYFTAKSKLPPDLHKPLWHMARNILLDLGERNPESVIGDEPDAPTHQMQPNVSNPAQGQMGGGVLPQGAPHG